MGATVAVAPIKFEVEGHKAFVNFKSAVFIESKIVLYLHGEKNPIIFTF